jgi:PAS domain S-box-containing protein
LDKEGRIRDVNAAGLALLGLPRTQVLKKRVQDLLRTEPGREVVPPRGLPTSPSPVQELRLRRRDGRVIEAEVSGRHLAGGHIQLVVHDLTERRRAAEALRQSEERYRRLADSAPDAVLVETGGRIVFMNAAGCRLFGASAPLVGRALADFIHSEDRDPVREMLREAVTGGRAGARLAGRFLKVDGTPVEVEGAATGISHRGRAALQIVVRERAEESGAPEGREAYRDVLTGLPGLPLLDDRLSVALSQAYRYRHRVGLVFVDLDGFGAVNEAMGRAAGDRLLRATESPLRTQTESRRAVARRSRSPAARPRWEIPVAAPSTSTGVPSILRNRPARRAPTRPPVTAARSISHTGSRSSGWTKSARARPTRGADAPKSRHPAAFMNTIRPPVSTRTASGAESARRRYRSSLWRNASAARLRSVRSRTKRWMWPPAR